MSPKVEKVVSPESVRWIERGGQDREYFAAARRKALEEAHRDMARRKARMRRLFRSPARY